MKMAKMMLSTLTAAFIGLGAGASIAAADVWHFTAELDGDQVTPPTSSDAWGRADLEYDDETNLLQVDLYVEGIGLDNDWTAAHIHIGRKGFAGPWNIQLGPLDEWFEDGNGIRRVLEDAVYPEEDERHLLTDGTFIMIHTVEWPGGEIRGQVVQKPRLSVTALTRNQPAFFHATNAEPNERVNFLYSIDGLGEGPSIPALGGLTLDILAGIQLLGGRTSDASGAATLRVNVPDNVPLLDIFTQAVIQRGPNGEDSVKSNTVSRVILP